MGDQAANLRRLASKTSYGSNGLKETGRMRVITIASGKGGVGKTSVVVNLAISLAKKGKRVMILDGDLGLANVDIMMGVIPRYSLYDVVQGGKRLDDVVFTGPEGVKVIPGGSGMQELANLADTKRSNIISQLREYENDVDYLLIDSGAGISKGVLGFVSAADDVIIILTPEPTSITDAYSVIKVLSKFDLQKEVFLIVNRVNGLQEGRETARKLEVAVNKFLTINTKCLGFISDDSAVNKSVMEQEPYILTYPRSQAAKDMMQMADNLIHKRMRTPQGTENFVNKLMRVFK